MNPHPNVAKDERQGDKEQPHMRIARAGVNPPLPPLAITGFDAETPAVSFADFRRSAADTPGGEKEFLVFFLARLCGLGSNGN